MLKQLDIKDFQAHKDSSVEFADGLTVLSGGNNQGKTAVLRALRWLAQNRPRGDSIIRHDQKQANVTLYLVGGEEIVRTKSKQGRNEYKLDGQTFKALGTDVPQQVVDMLGLTDINWQHQLDGVFLALDPPGKIASAINDVVHLDEPEEAANNLSASIRELDRKTKELKERENALECDLRPFKCLDQYEPVLSRLILLETNLTRSRAAMDGLDSLTEAIDSVDGDIRRTALPKRLGPVVAEYEAMNTNYNQIYNECADLVGVVDNLSFVDKQLSRIPDTEAIEKLLGETERAQRTVGRLGTEVLALDGWLRDIVDTEDLADEIEEMRAIRNGNYKGLLNSLNVCPACERPIEGRMKTKVVEYLT